jgi:hypothetical protein
MKIARLLVCTLRLLSASATVATPLLLGVTLVACEDDSDPKTWVKRLDDPAQRAKAITRLGQFYEDRMNGAGNDASAPDVKSLLDTILDPLTKQYTAGNLDDKTRGDLMKFLAETHDPRTAPALAKALNDWEMYKTDDEARGACESVLAMNKAGLKLDQTLIDALWNMFSKFSLAKYTALPKGSERLVRGLHDAVVAVHDPSYGDKAIEKLKVAVPDDPKNVDAQKDQLMFWQLTSVQVIKELNYTKAIHQLVATLLTPSKTGALGATIQFALLKMAKDANPELIKALNGGDPDYDKWKDSYKDKSNLGVIARVMAQLGLPQARDAILAMLPNIDTDTARTELAQALVELPDDGRCEPAYLDAYRKLTWDSGDELLGGLSPRIALAQQAAKFYDPKMLDWLLKEMKGAKDYAARIVQLESEAKLMTPDRKDDVAAALASLKKETPADGFAKVQSMFDSVSSALDKCKVDVNCYLGVLDEPISSASPTAYYKQVKATWMVVMFAGANKDAMRGELLKRVDKVKNTGARIAVCEAIDQLSPTGDKATADALDKIIAADAASGDKDVIATDNTVEQIAWRLRVRAQ